MNIFIRTDCSSFIGQGHVMRCLSLAVYLKQQAHKIIFLIRCDIPSVIKKIQTLGFEVYVLSDEIEPTRDFATSDAEETLTLIKQSHLPVDLLIVDHYQIDARWERLLRPWVKKILVIDDLANRNHDCDILLDQNIYDEQDAYQKLLPAAAMTLLGPKFALLRAEFLQYRASVQPRLGPVQRILIFFGGGDCAEATWTALNACKAIANEYMHIDVIVGSGCSEQDKIEQACLAMPNTRYFCQIDNIPEYMINADLALGAGGTITWERCCLGLPSLVQAIADNQVKIAQALSRLNALIYLGRSSAVNTELLAQALRKVISTPSKLHELSITGLSLVDGLGCQRVVQKIQEQFSS